MGSGNTSAVAVIVATYGASSWSEEGLTCAAPSATAGFEQVVHVHLGRGTLAEARNRAAELAHADWLIFLDADDRLDPGYAAAILPHLEYKKVGVGKRPEAKLLAPQIREMHSGKTYFPNRSHPMTELNHCVIGTVVPRWLFLKAGGFTELPIYEDWDLWLRCIRLGAEIEYVEEAIYIADMTAGRNLQYKALRSGIRAQIQREHLEATT